MPQIASMAFNILGINHKTAPVALREKVAFGEDRLVAALRTLRQESGVAEVVILSTCNRTELYWAGSASGAELSQWLARHHGNNLDLASSLYIHQDSRAVEHAFSVASGLDSMVLGEAQILGQLKDAYRVAQETGSTGPTLNKLFQAAFSAAKRVRSETRIGANAVSLASATVSLARRVYADLSVHNVLVVGAGEMNELTARHFMSAGVKRMVIANRTLGRAQKLAEQLKAHAVGLADLERELTEADIVISCTASAVPIISKRAVEAAIRTRRRRPIFMVDMAVPRDIEPEVADLEDVYLFSIDDLQQLVDENRQQRELAADGARLVINEEVARFLAQARAHDAGPAIRALRQQADGIRRQTVEQARRMLAAGKSSDEVIEYLANTLTNRLLHAPTQALRQASELADLALAETMTRLLTEERDSR
ncbi:MAG TPA: glutamyl-tRNA reductase [Steroidobacteraceae bacterium]|jgi:glutamyl-tRNA reductase|nr:glutamyl-tRNA reductase [Steroidobacteraceae bacterium]